MYFSKFSKSVVCGLGLGLSLALTCCKVPDVVAMESRYAQLRSAEHLNSMIDFLFSGETKGSVITLGNNVIDLGNNGKFENQIILSPRDLHTGSETVKIIDIDKIVERSLAIGIILKFGVYPGESEFEKLLRGSKKLLISRIGNSTRARLLVWGWLMGKLALNDMRRKFSLVNFDCKDGCENKGNISKMLFMKINGVPYSLCEECEKDVIESEFTSFTQGNGQCNNNNGKPVCGICYDEVGELCYCGKCKYTVCQKCIKDLRKCPSCRRYNFGKFWDKNFVNITKPSDSSIGDLYDEFVDGKSFVAISEPTEDFTIRKLGLNPLAVYSKCISEHNKPSSNGRDVYNEITGSFLLLGITTANNGLLQAVNDFFNEVKSERERLKESYKPDCTYGLRISCPLWLDQLSLGKSENPPDLEWI